MKALCPLIGSIYRHCLQANVKGNDEDSRVAVANSHAGYALAVVVRAPAGTDDRHDHHDIANWRNPGCNGDTRDRRTADCDDQHMPMPGVTPTATP